MINGWTPCHDECPAVTGKPYGTVQFCPAESQANFKRHREVDKESECCANFQCCADKFEAAGLSFVMHKLVEGHPTIEVEV